MGERILRAGPFRHEPGGQWRPNTRHAMDGANARRQRQPPSPFLPQAFLAVDAVLILYRNVASGLVVYPQVIARNLRRCPFMATNILMAAVQTGGGEPDLHERIRQHSQAAAAMVKEQGGSNDLLPRLSSPYFVLSRFVQFVLLKLA